MNRNSRRRVTALLAGTLAAASAMVWAQTPAPAASQAQAQGQAAQRVLLSTTLGDIVLELYPDKAPKTVANFLQYVRDKYYDGLVFHRVIPGFMIQGGGMDAAMTERKTREPIRHEGRLALANGLRNEVGTLAMARTSDPHSASAQFFINVADNRPLDPIPIPPGDPVPRFEYRGQVYENIPRERLEGAAEFYGYTVFGRVVSGMDVVNKIKAVPTGRRGMHADVPLTPVVITRATLVK